MMEKVLFSWSGGKDSALALYRILQNDEFDVMAMLTTLSEKKKVPMHEVDESLIRRQADSIGLPLVPVYIPEHADNDTYEKRLSETLADFRRQGVEKVVHADIFLEDIKSYRDKQLAKLDMEGVYPLWGQDTAKLAEQFVSLGFESIVTCVDTSVLGREFVGRNYNRKFLSDLPDDVDPCGENGEFHTFVYAGPIFREPITFEKTNTFTTWDGRFYHVGLK